MGVRESIRRVPPVYAYLAAIVCIALSAWAIWRHARGPRVLGVDKALQLRCSECGVAQSMSSGRIAHAISQLPPDQRVEPSSRTWPELPCPACGKPKLSLARLCPKDGEVFARWTPDGKKQATCHKCGWDPAAEDAARLAKITGN